jgi:hypothetical protein
MNRDGVGATTAIQSESPDWRFYRMTSVVVWGFIFGFAGGTVCVLIWVLDYYVHRHGSVVGLVGGVTVIVVVSGAIMGWTLATGVRETNEGLVTTENFSRNFVAWDEIDSVDVVSKGFQRVAVKCRSGRTVILALAPQRQVLWRGGSTADAVSTLTDRVIEVRASRGLAPIE